MQMGRIYFPCRILHIDLSLFAQEDSHHALGLQADPDAENAKFVVGVRLVEVAGSAVVEGRWVV